MHMYSLFFEIVGFKRKSVFSSQNRNHDTNVVIVYVGPIVNDNFNTYTNAQVQQAPLTVVKVSVFLFHRRSFARSNPGVASGGTTS